MKFGFVGAGFSCAVLARVLADAGHHCVVMDERAHVAGNCHTERDQRTGIMVHCFGPHIFHTNDEKVWRYINSFGDMVPYVNRVKAISGGKVFTLPVNLLTINQFFDLCLSPEEARRFIESKADSRINEPLSFEDQALRFLGSEIYEAFFRGYTLKQWGRDPRSLPASILKRLPVRFNYDDNYFSHRFQAMPRDGYTALVSNILSHERICVRLGTSFDGDSREFDHLFYSGPIDRYFEFRAGFLAYRTLDFEKLYFKGDYQGTAVLNFCDETVPFTRVTEHKHFAPWEAEKFDETICFREFSREAGVGDTPYYPVRLVDDMPTYDAYRAMALDSEGVSFVGRLGTYRYLDMDVCIGEALANAEQVISLLAENARIPAFLSA